MADAAIPETERRSVAGGPGRRLRATLTTLAVLALLLTACGGGADATDLAGVWKTPPGFYMTIDEDGSYILKERAPGVEPDITYEEGTYEFDGTTLTFLATNLDVVCADTSDPADPAIPGSYTVTIADDGSAFTTTLVEDECVWQGTPRSNEYEGEYTTHTP